MCILNKHLSFLLILSFTSFSLTGSIFLPWSCATHEKKENRSSPKKMMLRSLDATKKYLKRTFPLLCASILAITTAILRGIKRGHEKKPSLRKRILNDFVIPVSQVAKKMGDGLQKNYQKNKKSLHATLGISSIALTLFYLRNILLRWGIKLNNKLLVRFSLACGAQLGKEDSQGNNALCQSIRQENIDMARFLLSKGAPVSSFEKIIRLSQGCVFLRFLFEEAGFDFKGLTVNQQCACLLPAVLSRESGSLVFLKNKTRQLNDQVQADLLCEAISRDCYLSQEFLINRVKVDVGVKNGREKTALHHAIDIGKPDAALRLLDHTREVNIPDGSRRTPLICAAGRGCFSLVESLLRRGANVNAQDNQGRTALIEAVFNRQNNQQNQSYNRIIEYLVRKDADIMKRTKGGKTALKIAAKSGHENVIDYLRCQLIGKIYTQNTETCPICFEDPQTIGLDNCIVTPCCTNFVCNPDLIKTVLQSGECPMCRAKLAVAD
ncbi:hypothetical protein E3J79_01540 [Candidatus Dependentiae bacterium]|nr:MAG: hypothetical protein E3J79_01540 [Candidatus Dependentiae bacterium]